MPINFLFIKFLIWVFFGGLLISRFATPQHIEVLGKKRERWSIMAALLYVAPLIYWCATRDRGFGDTWAYYTDFMESPGTLSGVIPYARSFPKDNVFYGILAFGRAVFGSNEDFTFGMIACIQLLSLTFVYRKYSRNLWLSIFLFVASTDYTGWMYNGIRQFTAAAISFTALPFIVNKKYLPAALIIYLASTCHQSALILLPAMFIVQGKAWNKRTILIALSAIIAVYFVNEFTGFLDEMLQDTQYENVVSDWTEGKDDGTNVLRVLVYAVPTAIAFLWRSKIQEADNPLIHLCTNMSILSSSIYLVSMFTSGIYIGRLPVYFSLYNYILLPWELRHCFKKDSRIAVTASMVVFYLIFYLYSYL